MIKLLSLILLVSTATAQASYPELFGASFSTTAIGNQANSDINDPSNNYYAPAMLGFTDKFNVLTQATSTAVYFNKIKDIVVTNSTNSNPLPNPETKGDVNTPYPKFVGSALHASIPIGGTKHLGSIGLSVFLPIGDMIKTHSGDPFLPEYVMFRSRHQRTSAYLNFAKQYSDTLSWSLGAILGFQATANVKTNMSLNGTDYGSWVTAQTEVAPALGVIASLAKKLDKAHLYFTYQQEMKSNLKAQIGGNITNPVAALFDATLSTMIFYDPHVIRVGGSYQFQKLEVFSGLEYQMWGQYKTPRMDITKNSGVVISSENFEKINLRDTLNPRIGIKYNWTDRWHTSVGAQYRMTPFKGDFSGSGNSVDVNTLVAAAGIGYRMVIWSKDVHLGGSFQYHSLESKKVIKSPGQENNKPGSKIGSPGYDLGGHIIAGSFGVKFNF